MTQKAADLSELYSDVKTCAKLVGLSYVDHSSKGYCRLKKGSGFTYRDLKDQTIVDKKMKAAITELVIPPAWQEVWICPKQNGHVLATGIDEKGRKQYIYHPKWRTMRDLIKFYRMTVFGAGLPTIRKAITKSLSNKFDRDSIMAIMLWVLDNTYIRIGNDVYFDANESVGLTTLTDKNVMIAGSVVTLSFKGKSGKDQQITFDNKQIAASLTELRKVRGARLFRYQDNSGWHNIEANDINAYLHEVTKASVSAKDFRTWGGTLLAFDYLLEEDAKKHSAKPEKAIVAAVDQVAAILGNTRTVARSSYVHPDLLSVYGSKDFAKYYNKAKQQPKITGLESRESELLNFLQVLFEHEFTLLKKADSGRSSTKND